MKTECVTAVIRIRPLNKKEKQEKDKECIDLVNKNSLKIKHLKESQQTRRFTFDRVFDSQCTQEQVYTQTSFPIVEKVFEGYNGTVFAYGQTGCGKTHTMVGNPQCNKEMGIIPRVFKHCRSIVAEEKSKQFLIHGSFLEIYNECIYDLLVQTREKLSIKNDPKKGIFIDKLQKVPMNSLEAMNQVMNNGNQNRTVGATAMNEGSSRSHSIFIIYIESANTIKNNKQYTSSKLSLVDLAGSEKTKKTQATGQRLLEGTKINQSLSVLGNVIKALVDGKAKFIPYRDSKLTRLLQDSLGGNTKTVMIAAVSPAFSNFEESLSTLRYANRAKSIKNKPVVNIDEKDLLLKKYQEDIENMKKLLMQKQNNNSISEQAEIKNEFQDKNQDLNQQKIQEEQEKQKQLFEQLKKLQEQMSNKDNQEEINKLQKERENIKIKRQKELEFQMEQQKKIQEENKKKILQESELIETQIQELKNQIQDKKNELEDLENENLDQKTSIVKEFQQIDLSLKFYKQIIQKQISDQEIERLKNFAKFSDKLNTYKLPTFFVDNKKIKIVKIPKHEFQALQEKNFQSRNLIFVTEQLKKQFNDQKIQKNKLIQKTDYKLKQKEINKLEEHFNKFPSDQKPKKYYNSKQYKLKSIKNPII